MFEQSILLDHATGKKTRALALSLTAQTLAVAGLFVLPLIYNDRLPRVWVTPALPMPVLRSAPEPTPVQPTSQTTRLTASRPRIFNPLTLTSHLAPVNSAEPAQFDMPTLPSGGQVVGVPGGFEGAAPIITHVGPPPPAKPIEVAKPAPSKPIPVSSGVQSAKLIHKVIPVYPPLARQARISGTVRLVGVIAKDGTIQQLQLVSGHPLLVQAALDAVRQWVYRPTTLSGEPVEVIAPIDVIFTLSQ